jgi:hypothetical protein
MTQNILQWKKCTTCKKSIGFSQKYWTCSVSTCTRVRTGLTFCSVACFDIHVPVLNHKDAWALENDSPKSSEPNKTLTPKQPEAVSEYEILVVTSKVKDYIRKRSGMNTSASALDSLSDAVRKWCQDGIQSALKNGRKTLLDRDIGA